VAQFDIAAARLENSLWATAQQQSSDITPVLIQYQIVISKLSLLLQPSEATALVMQIQAYREAIVRLQLDFNDIGSLIDQLQTRPELAAALANRVKKFEDRTSELAQAVADAEVEHRDIQIRDFLKNRRTFYATTAAVFLTMMMAIAALLALLHQRRAAVQAKDRAARAAQDAVNAKNAFLGVIGHELRTPLQTITSAIDTLSDRPHSTRDMKIILRLEQATQQMITQMHDLTDYSRLESGKLKVVNNTFDAADLLRDVVEDAVPQARQKGLSIRFEAVPGSASSFTDPSRLRQIASNLLNNAIKYSDRGEIVLRLSLIPNTAQGAHLLQFAVEDQGIGIPAEQIKTMFEPFTQLDQSHTRRHEGIGMGLAIVKGLVELLQGDIQVKSTMGQGSCFTVSVPSLRPAAPQRDLISSRTPPAADLILTTDLRVLVVDDQQAIRDSFSHLLTSMKLKFDVSPDADDALRCVC
jgi:signal transduction histidine kinase